MKVFYLGLYTTQKPLTNLKGRVGDRVGSSPTSRTKKTFGSFFVGGTFALCATNALHLEPTLCGWRPSLLARLRSQVDT